MRVNLIMLVSLVLAVTGCLSRAELRANDTGQLVLEEAQLVGKDAGAATNIAQMAELCRETGEWQYCQFVSHVDPVNSDASFSQGSAIVGVNGQVLVNGAMVGNAQGTRVTGPSAAAYTTSAAFGGQEVRVEREDVSPGEQIFRIYISEDVAPDVEEGGSVHLSVEPTDVSGVLQRLDAHDREIEELQDTDGELRTTDHETARTLRSLGELLEE